MNKDTPQFMERITTQFKTLEKYKQKGGKDGSKHLDTKSIFKFADLYFRQKNILYSHLHNSFNKFLRSMVVPP